MHEIEDIIGTGARALASFVNHLIRDHTNVRTL